MTQDSDTEAEAGSLCHAVARLDRTRVAALVTANAPLEAPDSQGRTPLMLAAMHANIDITRFLLEVGADPNAQAPGEPARGLGAAAARALAEREGDEHRTPLSFAVESGELEIVEMLLASGANPYNAGATTPLDLAVLGGDAELVRALLEAGADPNERDSEGDTPLMLAAASGGVEVIAVLMEMGAIVSARNDDGDDALLAAARAGQHAAFEVLAAHASWLRRCRARRVLRSGGGGRRLAADRIDRLHRDALHGRLSAVRKALMSGVPADARRKPEDPSALFQAVRGGHLSVIRALLHAGADPALVARGDTPLTFALGPGTLDPRARGEIVRALVEGGAELEQTDADGMTPLMRAVVSSGGDETAVAVLCALGADPAAEHLSGVTAIDLARQDPSKARIAMKLEATVKRMVGAQGVELGEGQQLAAETSVASLRGLGDRHASEVVLAVRAPIDRVCPMLEERRGGRQWCRGIYARDGFFPGEEGYLAYQLRGHAWTLVQSDLIDARALRRRDAKALSRVLDCHALLFETCEPPELIRYTVYRSGRCLERFRVAAQGGRRVPHFESILREVSPAELEPAIDFVDRSFASFQLYVPGFGNDRLASLPGKFAPSDFERVDFLRIDRA